MKSINVSMAHMAHAPYLFSDQSRVHKEKTVDPFDGWNN